jgi:hypothetical protein
LLEVDRMRAGHLLVATAALLVGLAAGPEGAFAAARSPSKAAPKKTGTAKKKTTTARTAPKKKPSGELRRKPAPRKVAAATAAPTAVPETVETAPRPSAERRLTRDQRFRAARAGAKSALKPFAGGGLDIEAVLAREQISLTPGASNFLGRGPVRVIVRPKLPANATRWQRWKSAFRPNHNRRVLMSVSEAGVASVMDDEPDAIQHRVWRKLNSIIPVAEITRDVVSSEKAKAGLVGALGGLFTAAIRPEIAVGIALVALRYVGKGVQERRVARSAALDQTAEFVRQKEAAGETPAVSVAYRFYEGEMEEVGSRPISKDAFVEQMSYRLGKPVKIASPAATATVATTTATPTPAPAPAN